MAITYEKAFGGPAGAGEGEAAAAAAGAKREAAGQRLAKLRAGEDVAGGLGKPVAFEQLLLDAGVTKADIARCRQVAEVSKAFGFSAMMRAILEARDRAERRALRALHRRIADQDGEDHGNTGRCGP